MNGASVTVSSGSFAGNAVTRGTGGQDGSAYGADLFLGANVAFDVSSGQTLSIQSLGGAGNLADPNVAANANDPNAQGGIVKTGGGLLTLTGTSYYSGITTIHSGTLALAAGAVEQGTTIVTVGQNAGDVATLQLGGSSNLALAGWNPANPAASTDQPVMIAQDAGSTGTIVIGDGPGSNGAFIGARTFTGGSGTASIVFMQHYNAPAGTDPVYQFSTTLTGSMALVQDGLGTTSLQPLYGTNTFVGPVTINAGTLATAGATAALAGVSGITVNSGGVLSLGQTEGVNEHAQLTLAGGVLETDADLMQTLASLSVTGSTSIIDYLGNSSTLIFSSLSLAPTGHLSIWNYDGTNDFLYVTSGIVSGDLADIAFYSDSGSTFLGYGGFADGNRLVAVPEPSTVVMAVAGLACGGYRMLRRRKRA
jgi:autotransporter-associated beta strand protein